MTTTFDYATGIPGLQRITARRTDTALPNTKGFQNWNFLVLDMTGRSEFHRHR